MAVSSFDYEIHGIVQGVRFRVYTVALARILRINGYVTNTSYGTVKGFAEGTPQELGQFEKFLTNIGSPLSVIEKADINNRKENALAKHTSFRIFY